MLLGAGTGAVLGKVIGEGKVIGDDINTGIVFGAAVGAIIRSITTESHNFITATVFSVSNMLFGSILFPSFVYFTDDNFPRGTKDVVRASAVGAFCGLIPGAFALKLSNIANIETSIIKSSIATFNIVKSHSISILTKQELITPVIFIGAVTMLPSVMEYSYKIFDFKSMFMLTGGIVTSSFVFGHNFKNTHSKMGVLLAASLQGAGYYIIYKGFETSLNYVLDNISENYNFFMSVALTAGVAIMTPKSFQKFLNDKITLLAITVEELFIQKNNEQLVHSDANTEQVHNNIDDSNIAGSLHNDEGQELQ